MPPNKNKTCSADVQIHVQIIHMYSTKKSTAFSHHGHSSSFASFSLSPSLSHITHTHVHTYHTHIHTFPLVSQSNRQSNKQTTSQTRQQSGHSSPPWKVGRHSSPLHPYQHPLILLESKGNIKIHKAPWTLTTLSFFESLLCDILVTYHLHMLHSWEVEELSQLKDTIE